MWQKGEYDEMRKFIKRHIQACGGWGVIRDPQVLSRVPDDIIERFQEGSANYRERIERIRELHRNMVLVRSKVQTGVERALYFFHDPNELRMPLVIIYDDIWLSLMDEASSSLSGYIYFSYPYLYRSLEDFLRELDKKVAHESVHEFRAQRLEQDLAKLSGIERFVHEGLASYIGDEKFYMDDGMIEQEMSFWLPLTLRYVTSREDLEQLKEIAKVVVERYVDKKYPYNTSLYEIVFEADFMKEYVDLNNVKEVEEELSEIFLGPANPFYKTARYMVRQIVERGSEEMLRYLTSQPGIEIISTYQQLGCNPPIDSLTYDMIKANSY